MISFTVNDMTCGHCVKAVTQAVQSVDKGARVDIDLAAHEVRIEPSQAGASELAEAIKEAGYTPLHN